MNWNMRGAERVEIQHLVIGAGVVGLAAAAAIARRGEEVFVLEAGPGVGCGISSRNSEVIHSGIYYETGTLKHRLCVDGRRRLYDYCAARGIAHNKCGKLIVATNDSEAAKVVALSRQAEANGVENVALVDGSALQRMEPALHATVALHVAETGIVDSHALMLALVGEIEETGGAVLTGHRVVGGESQPRGGFEIIVETQEGLLIVVTRNLILAAGPWSHAVAARIGGIAELARPRLYLAKGSYFSHAGAAPFSRLIYPVPEPGGLGVHLTLDLGGAMRFGPDVEWLDSNDPDAVDFTVELACGTRFYDSVRRYWPGLADGALQPAYAGVRPKLSGPGEPGADFLVKGPPDHGVPGFVELYGVESPGLTSALALAELVASMLGPMSPAGSASISG
jgi:L-2-hydroxyglutarate oxidase LhgO